MKQPPERAAVFCAPILFFLAEKEKNGFKKENGRPMVAPTSAPEHSRKIHGIAEPVCALARNDASILEPLRRMEEFMQTLQMVLYFQALKC